MMAINSFLSDSDFYDVINFRHGFARSGMFTKSEAEILRRCGHAIKRLANGSVRPEDEVQESMLRVLDGVQEPSNEVEKAWVKYLLMINTKVPKFSGLSSKGAGIDYSEPSDGAW